MNTFIAVAKKNNQFKFGFIDGIKYPKFVSSHSLGTLPIAIVFDGPNQVFYSPQDTEWDKQPMTEASLEGFLKDVQQGKISARGAGSGIFGFIKVCFSGKLEC